jgi:transposase
MDKAHEGDATREKAFECNFNPVVPPKSNRIVPWQYDVEAYKQRNQVERLFRRLKRFRRVFTRYDKTDIMYTAFITFALIFDLFKLC